MFIEIMMASMLTAAQSWEDTCTSNPDGGLYGEETCPPSSPDEPIGDPGGSGLPGGGGPTPLDPPVDSDTGPLTPCQARDAQMDMTAGLAMQEVWQKCVQTGNEWGAVLYLDDNGNVQATPAFTGTATDPDGSPNDISPTMGYVDAGIDPSRIVGFIHCHPSPGDSTRGSTDDDLFFNQFGQWANVNGDDTADNLSNWIVADENSDPNDRDNYKYEKQKYRENGCVGEE